MNGINSMNGWLGQTGRHTLRVTVLLVACCCAAHGRAQAPVRERPPGGQGQAAQWKGMGVSSSAPLPPAGDFEPRRHGLELARAGLAPDVIARLDVEMQRHVAARNVAGISAIIHKDGVRGWGETFGMADIEKGRTMEQDAIFRLMSMTKPVIALAALTLYDEGRFTLDDPIAKHCPEWAEPTVKDGNAVVAARAAITPRMLMSHSSGLGYGGGQAAAAMAYQAMTKPGATLKEFSEAVAREPLMFQPGTSYSYGMGLDILGRYLEALTGQPLDVVLRARLFGPLKMPDTDFHVPAKKVGRLCQIYGQPTPGVLVPGTDLASVSTKPTLFLGGHGLFGTIGDYERLCRMILGRGELDGVRVLEPETVDLLFENQLRHPTMKYGLGGIVNGAGSYGWGGADGTQFVVDRNRRTITLFMVQTQHYKAPTYPAFLALANEACGLPATLVPAPHSTAAVEPTATAELAETLNQPYGAAPGVDANLLALDIHAPKTAKGLPVVVYVHGGYWKAGDKSQTGHLPEFFCQRGFVFVSVNYRLAPAVKHPVIIQDVARAVAWVHDHVAEHGGDPSQIFLTGHSAGAQLVALLGTDATRLGEHGKPLSILRAVIPLDSAAMDIRSVAANDRRADSPYRAAFGDDPADWADASPIVHAETTRPLPPFQIVVAYGPALDNKKSGVNAFAATLRKVGTRAEVVDASSLREHQSLITQFGTPGDRVSATVLEFIESVRKATPVAGLGSERVIEPDGSTASAAAGQIEAYRLRVLMKRFDTSGDGRLTRDEMQANPFLFERMDGNKDGVVTAGELGLLEPWKQPSAMPGSSKTLNQEP